MYPIVLSAPSEPGDLAFSALPDAPVVPPRPSRLPRGTVRGLRAGLATRLHGLAAAVEPAPRPRTLRG